MQLNVLHLDCALSAQTDFIRAAGAACGRHLHAEEDGPQLRLWARQHQLDIFMQKLRTFLTGDAPQLTFMGSGDFHHITALLLAAAAEKFPAPLTLVHFDNHPDWVKFPRGMHCGSWLNNARMIANVTKVFTLGICSDDIYKSKSAATLDLLGSGFLEILPYGSDYQQIFKTISTENIYITLDKDVLVHDDTLTNWDQGKMRLDDIAQIITSLGTRYRIIGADVIGDVSPVCFGGSLVDRFLKTGEVFLDHPQTHVDHTAAARINASANIALLNTFAAVMA